jgi:hypothetical protein
MLPSSGTGQITGAVMRKLLGELVIYETVSDIIAANIDFGISSVNALGNTMRGDGGGGLYKIASTQAAGPGKIQSADGQYWELMFQTGYIGSISKAGGVTAADLPAGMAAVVKDTSSGNVYLAYNDAGAIATANLTAGTIASQALIVTPSANISMSCNQGANPSQNTFTYTLSSSSGNVNYSITWVPGWLTLSIPATGSVTTTGTTATFTASSAGLSPNTYNATITFTNTTNGQGNATRLVALTVAASAQPVLQLIPITDITTSGNPGGPFSPTQWTYQLSTTQGTANFSVTGIPNWLECSPRTGNVGTTGTTINFQNNSGLNSLSAGTYPSTISFTNTDTGAGTATRNATVTVLAAAPALVVTPAVNMSPLSIRVDHSHRACSRTLSSLRRVLLTG